MSLEIQKLLLQGHINRMYDEVKIVTSPAYKITLNDVSGKRGQFLDVF